MAVKQPSEAGWRRDTLSLVVSGNDHVKRAANLLRKSPRDTTGSGWVREPEDWRKVEEALTSAIDLYERALKVARYRADQVDGS